MSRLMASLGFRAPDRAEASGAAAAAAGVPAGVKLAAAVLHASPLISYSSIVRGAPLGVASAAGGRLADRSAWFLLSPAWSIESEEAAAQLRHAAIAHRARNPRHKLVFVGNTPEEVDGLRAVGEAAFFFNKTAHVAERMFVPLDGIAVDFDAIYNAQLIPWKRHELSLDIPRCAFLFYRDSQLVEAAASEAAILARHAANSGHVFINRFDRKHVPIRLGQSEVNRHLNRASVGLCLSEQEGAMFASMEYLMSGLPIVSTPSQGGRHVYFDDDYCWTVPPDPRSVAEAVQALKGKAIPRAHIRGRTLQRVERDRVRFLDLLNTIMEEEGSDRRLAMPWPFMKRSTLEWMPQDEAVHRATHGIVDGFARKKRRKGFLLWRKWWPRLLAKLNG